MCRLHPFGGLLVCVDESGIFVPLKQMLETHVTISPGDRSYLLMMRTELIANVLKRNATGLPTKRVLPGGKGGAPCFLSSFW